MTVILIVIDALGTVTRGLVQVLEDLEMRTGRDHPNDCIIKIGPNTEKNPDLWTLVVAQTAVENHQLTLMRKTLKMSKIIIIIKIIS